MKIRIIAVPPGEAPEEVRKAWVGLVLPLAAGERGKRRTAIFGVVSGPTTFWDSLFRLLMGRFERIDGYLVDAPAAIETLAESSPVAANWWRNHAPYFLRKGKRLVFHSEACQEQVE